ncbi:MAG: hypothetical protein OXF02_05925 [Simkaniaceae bacterium]|nr:hypothetical protein [Simkaniaceae bacterium]
MEVYDLDGMCLQHFAFPGKEKKSGNTCGLTGLRGAWSGKKRTGPHTRDTGDGDIAVLRRKIASERESVREKGELALELCEIAHLLYRNRFSEGIRRFTSLSEKHKKNIAMLCRMAGMSYPDPEYFTDITDGRDKIMGFIRVLIGYAGELVNEKDRAFAFGIPLEAEVHDIFKGAVMFDAE